MIFFKSLKIFHILESMVPIVGLDSNKIIVCVDIVSKDVKHSIIFSVEFFLVFKVMKQISL